MPEETQAYYELDHVDERHTTSLYNEAPARPVEDLRTGLNDRLSALN